eukprot:CAMPEP_0202345592 /NCGR_PEP_ID=MMETSP1126-20121109/4764_1 /ASSEMBLY_ACC=CAM_ASM_000457 /TAXON_ID=3047 /ORGANISM="Dunaliella tertiolecta, Strain CCMP1320" /LENGTH=62 /DNA_ID=CAMNT_0048936917 /DNA_START=1289 /DNA_END=1477 /DNA_ORIENTATION=-
MWLPPFKELHSMPRRLSSGSASSSVLPMPLYLAAIQAASHLVPASAVSDEVTLWRPVGSEGA